VKSHFQNKSHSTPHQVCFACSKCLLTRYSSILTSLQVGYECLSFKVEKGVFEFSTH